MRLCRQAFIVAILLLATPSGAKPFHDSRLARPVMDSSLFIAVANEDKQAEPDTDILALPSGKCSVLKIAGRDFACRAVAFFQNEQGRANFVIALDDPDDGSHIITFSGDNGRREKDLYELQIDRMLLNSKDRPKVDGLPVPVVELSTGTCKQTGNLTTTGISGIACSAADRNGKTYEVKFESDGTPTTVRRIVRSSLVNEKRRAKQIEQLECRQKADAAKILPRDRTAYIIGCLEKEDSQKPAPATDQ
jgi:hypothetical protein